MRLTVLFLMATLAASAQFVGYPTPGVPKNKDGTPNLTALAPKTSQGKPDLSGMWDNIPARPCVIATDNCNDRPAIDEFFNLAAGVPEGKLPYQPWAAELVAGRATRPNLDPISHCQPTEPVRLLTYPTPRKIVQMPNLILILSERDVTFRQVFLDGRPLPKDPTPSYHGYSVGHWEGDTLVVETNGLKDDLWIDRRGSPITEAAHITERYRRINFGTLEIKLTIDDPKAYTKPFSITIKQRLMVNDELMELFCNENEKDQEHLPH